MPAEVVGRAPEATSPAVSPATNISNEGGDQTDDNGGSTTDVGTVSAGGVVGGVSGLVAITALLFFFQRKKLAPLSTRILSQRCGGDRTRAQAQCLHDTPDPSTFPTPIPVTEGATRPYRITPPLT